LTSIFWVPPSHLGHLRLRWDPVAKIFDNTLSARTLTLAEEAAKAPEMVRKQLETQLNECRKALDIAKGEVDDMSSDVQGFINPQGSRGKGQEGKGQGKDFMTLNKP
jgi:hypothetical protein